MMQCKAVLVVHSLLFCCILLVMKANLHLEIKCALLMLLIAECFRRRAATLSLGVDQNVFFTSFLKILSNVILSSCLYKHPHGSYSRRVLDCMY